MADPTPGPPGGNGPGAGPGFARATAVMSVGTTLSRLTGFLRLAVMAWAIGGAESKLPDTYQLANTLPNIVYQLILGEVLATLFVPVFVGYLTTRSRQESWRLASTIFTLSIIAAAAFAAVMVLIAPWLIQIYTFHLEGPERIAQEEVGAFFLRLLMPQMIFYSAGMVLTGLLNAHRRFALPMFAPVFNNLIVTGTFIAFRLLHGAEVPTLATLTTGDKLLLGLGTTAGVVVMTLALLPGVRRLPGRLRFRELEWRHPAVRHVANLARFSLGYVVVSQIGLWVIKTLANRVQGGVAAYDTAFVIFQLPYGIFAVSVMTALVPALSEHHVRGDPAAFRRDLSLGLRTSSFVTFPAAAGLVALSQPIVRLLLERGVFGIESRILFADTLLLMSVGLVTYAIFHQAMRAFYAMQDTRTPWRVNIWANLIAIAVSLALFPALAVPGLALAHALAHAAAAFIGLGILRHRLGGIDGRRLLSSHLRIGFAAVATGLTAWVVAERVGARVDLDAFAGQILQVGSAVGAGLILYVAMAAALRLDEIRPLWRMVAGRLSREGEDGP